VTSTLESQPQRRVYYKDYLFSVSNHLV